MRRIRSVARQVLAGAALALVVSCGGSEGTPGAAPLELTDTGQLLFGLYYDVRPVENPGSGTLDPQVVNIVIHNTAPGDGSVVNQGVLARVRFRESKTGQEALTFNIPIACGGTWTASLSLDPATEQTQLASPDAIVVTDPVVASPISYAAVLSGSSSIALVVPSDLTFLDVQRGFFEIVAMEALPCFPATGDERSGTYDRLTGCPGSAAACTPPNTLAGSVTLVRPLTGSSYDYDLEAIAGFVADGAGGNVHHLLSPRPSVEDCKVPLNGGPTLTSDPSICRDTVSFALAKSSISFPWTDDDLMDDAIAVFTLATKPHYCEIAAGDFNGVPVDPFGCGSVGSGMSETVECTSNPEPTAGGGATPCPLPRVVSVWSVTDLALADARADVSLARSSLIGNPTSGNLELDLHAVVAFPPNGHRLRRADDVILVPAGMSFNGFDGLPVLALIIQEHFDGVVRGVTAVPPPSARTMR
jgi:hypothetical protein